MKPKHFMAKLQNNMLNDMVLYMHVYRRADM